MSDNEKRAHELAMLVVSEVMSRDFDTMKNAKNDGNNVREVLAVSVLDEYNFFFDAFQKSMK